MLTFGALLILLALAGGTGAAQQLQLPTFVTVGSGYVIVPADRVVISIGIETEGATAQAAQQANDQVMQAITEQVRATTPGELEFGARKPNVTLQRASAARGGEPSYRATSGLDVIIGDDSQIGAVIDVAIRQGAASVQGVKFQASSLEDAARQALANAVEDAIAKANIISQATGMRIVMIRRVTDANQIEIINPSDQVLIGSEGGSQYALHAGVQRGEIMVQVEVTVEFEVALR